MPQDIPGVSLGNINKWVTVEGVGSLKTGAYGLSQEGSLLLPWQIQGSHFSREAMNLDFKKIIKFLNLIVCMGCHFASSETAVPF